MFGEKIKNLRISKGLNQEAVWTALKINKNTYSAYEKETQSPQLKTIEKLAEFYGISVIELIGETKGSIDHELETKLKMLKTLDDDEKESIMMVIEGMLLRHRSRSLIEEFKK